jgi:hypothetical protein
MISVEARRRFRTESARLTVSFADVSENRAATAAELCVQFRRVLRVQVVALYKSSAGYLMRSSICIPGPAQPVEGDYDRFPAHARLGQMARLARTSVTGSETPI